MVLITCMPEIKQIFMAGDRCQLPAYTGRLPTLWSSRHNLPIGTHYKRPAGNVAGKLPEPPKTGRGLVSSRLRRKCCTPARPARIRPMHKSKLSRLVPEGTSFVFTDYRNRYCSTSLV